MLEVFPFNLSPHQELQLSQSQRYKQFQFGDGYQQRSPETVNPNRVSVSLKWRLRDEALESLRNFLETVGQTVPFLFNCPGVGLDAWVCDRYSQIHLGADAWEVQADFQRWYSAGRISLLTALNGASIISHSGAFITTAQ